MPDEPVVTTPPAAEPELILGKYKSQDDLVAAHKELETRLGQSTARIKELEKPKPPAAEPVKPDGLSLDMATPEPSEIDIPDILKAANLDASVVTQQWEKEGKLTDEQYAAFKVGNVKLTRSTIDTYLSGLKATAALAGQRTQQATEIVFNTLGGQTQWNNIIASSVVKALPAARRDDINNRLGNPDTAEGAARELVELYNKANGTDKSRHIVVGRTSGGGVGDAPPYTSQGELLAARDAARKKHGGQTGDELKDPEFRARSHAFVKQQNMGRK